ncbi:MAG: T9SS type A sorting domain-containing protein, partial [Raineya sp.]|nr:T9SS type A sorting domain-containing protein [Raineya sp.]
FIELQVSVNGGAFTRELRVRGNSQNGWSFASTGVINATYEGDLSPTLYSTPTNAAISISTIRLNLPSWAFQVSARIIMRNNNNQERWVVDNVRLFTDPAPPPAPPIPLTIFAYDGFDYYEDNEEVSGMEFYGPGEKNQTTVASVFPSSDVSIHQFMTSGTRFQTVNSEVSLGWAGDWFVSDPAQQDKYYLGGTNDGSSQILVQNGSYPIACDDQSNNLVNSGLFLQTRSGFPLGVSVGRRLQTSTGGPFFLYYIQGAPLPAGTNPVTSGAVQVHPQSPIVFTNTANPNATPTQHKNQSLEPNPNNRTTTFNTRIGADGSTIWFAVMMRKGASNNNPVFVSLHKHTNVWDTNPNGAIQVGYFGTNGVNPRHWAVRINGTIYYAGTNNTTHPTANNTNTRIQTCEEDTPSGSNYRGDEWDLLVLEIKYNYGPNKLFSAPGDDNHRVRMYVIRDFRRDTHPADPEAGLGGVVQSGANFTQFIANEVNLETGWDIQVTGLQGDLTFHSLAFQGSGGYTGPSGLPSVTDNLYFSDAIDEIRFGASFAAACLYSPTVSLIKGLCEQNGGTSGENIFPEGTFGIAESLTPEGFLATNVTIATQSFEGSGSSVAATGNTGIEWNYTPTLAAANFSAGTNAATGIPASANLYSDGSRGVQLLNNTGALQTLTITTNSIALPKPAGVNNVYVLVDLAGMGNAAGEGVDNTGDQIVLAISTDNGTTYQDEVTIQPSGANVGWNLGGAITNDPAIGTNNTIATNPGRVRIYLPSGATNVSLRITMTNNATNERWVIDNIRLEALNQTAVGEQIATAVGRYNPSENPNAKSRNPAILADSDCPGGNNANCPVVFEDGTALIGTPPVAYNALTGPNYTYVFNQDNRPNDGMYMIANRSGHLFGSNTNNPSWYPVYDNTNKNKNGMLMNVNAAYAKAQFYSKSVGGICGGTQYEFYVDAFNTLRAIRRTVTNPAPTLPAGTTCNKQREPGCQQMSFAGTDATGNSGIGAASEGDFDDTSSQVTSSYHINPELQFLINGKPLYTPPISIPNNSNGNTDHIPADTDGPVQWRRTGFTFVTKPSITNLTVSFRNIAPGGNGNDLNIDNITFRPCGPRSRIRQEIAVPNNYCPSGDNLLLDIGSIGTSTTSRVARWEYSCDGGNTWAPLPPPIPNPMPVTTPYLDLANGYYHGSTTSSVVNIYQLSPASNPNPMVPDPNKPLVNGCMIRVIFAESPDNLNNPKCRFIAGPITIDCPNPLLATEIQASAKAQNNGIAVRWYMSQENGMKEYIIERSVDMLNFTPITRFVAKNTGQIYTYIDVIPFEGRNYYRIKGITQNGETKYSNVVSEEWSGKGGINIYPNPTDLGVYVAFSKLFEQREHIKVRLLNTMGIFVMEKDYYLEGTQKTIFIPTENLANGIYLLEIGIGDFKYVSKLVVKH